MSVLLRRLDTIIVLSFLVIAVGGYVRIIEAGLACPDWPLCHGKLIPTFDTKVFWEWGHRLLALATFVYVLYFAWVAWFSTPRYRWHLLIMLLVFIAQALLGALTVTELLAPKIVNIHFFNALLLLSFFLWFRLSVQRPETSSVSRGSRIYLLLVFSLLLLQFLLGSLMSANYGGYACASLPTCDGNWTVPTTNSQLLHMLHRLLGVVLFLATCGFFLLPRSSSSLLHKASMGVPLVAALQVLLGVLSIYFEMSVLTRTLHFLLAIMLYILIFTTTCVYLLPRPHHA